MIGLVIIASFLHTVTALDCSVNLTQGIPWTVGDQSINFADLTVDTLSGLSTPVYPVQVLSDTDANVTQTIGWNRTSNASGTSIGYWQSLTPDNTVNFGAILSESGQSSAPTITSIDLDGTSCSLGDPIIVQPAARTEAALSPVSVQNGKLYGTDGQPLALKGFNWFGMEEPGNSMLDGLWFVRPSCGRHSELHTFMIFSLKFVLSMFFDHGPMSKADLQGSDSISKDFATIVYRYQLLGFNAVRLPMNFQNLYNLSPKIVSQSCNVDSQQTIAGSTRDPSSSASPSSAPSQRAPPPTTPGQCNA